MRRLTSPLLALLFCALACTPSSSADGGQSTPDSGSRDAGMHDAGVMDAGVTDAGVDGGVWVVTDLAIYGATPGGVFAAVAAGRAGARVLLLEPSAHLGGMTTGGLGNTDVGVSSTITGLAREFYTDLGAFYGLTNTAKFQFEPHAALAVMTNMLADAGVRVELGVAVDGVSRDGTELEALHTAQGAVVAPLFLDGTYEGDLLPLAQVDFLTGREANALYAERHNGVTSSNGAHNFTHHVDPYLTPGDPSSGLLPFIGDGHLVDAGTADTLIQSYNFRLCLTSNSANRTAIPAPADYDAGTYELLGRWVDALADAGTSMTPGTFMNIVTLPNGKSDVNNNGAFSTDLIGADVGYLEADAAGRQRIFDANRSYTLGFLHYLATSPRLPANVRTSMGNYGFCKDEFTDTDGFSPALYVREGRRMVGAHVMTENDVDSMTTVTDGIALGSYNKDVHNAQRLVVNGFVKNEGDVQVAPAGGPYPIAYRSLTPPASKVTNLLVPVAMSATHIAYGSIRMEPVFMMMGTAAGKAAVLALHADAGVQAVDVTALRAWLTDGGQLVDAP